MTSYEEINISGTGRIDYIWISLLAYISHNPVNSTFKVDLHEEYSYLN